MFNKYQFTSRILSVIALSVAFGVESVMAQSGGTFTITESVIAAGGESSSGGTFTLDGTTGQSLAGDALSGSPFAVTGGFWNFTPLAPTGAEVTIGGRILTAHGTGISNVRINLTASNGETQSIISSSFGFYRFDNVAVGETCIISVSAKRFAFSQPVKVVSVVQELSDLDFIANF